MRDPFKRASRRVIRRLGGFTPIDAQSDTGARIPNFKGIYENPEEESLRERLHNKEHKINLP